VGGWACARMYVVVHAMNARPALASQPRRPLPSKHNLEARARAAHLAARCRRRSRSFTLLNSWREGGGFREGRGGFKGVHWLRGGGEPRIGSDLQPSARTRGFPLAQAHFCRTLLRMRLHMQMLFTTHAPIAHVRQATLPTLPAAPCPPYRDARPTPRRPAPRALRAGVWSGSYLRASPKCLLARSWSLRYR
jgi:hypothetical protein